MGQARLSRRPGNGLALPAGATLSDAFAALAEKLPALVAASSAPIGRVSSTDMRANVNGLAFVRTPAALVNPGDSLVISIADGGRLAVHGVLQSRAARRCDQRPKAHTRHRKSRGFRKYLGGIGLGTTLPTSTLPQESIACRRTR